MPAAQREADDVNAAPQAASARGRHAREFWQIPRTGWRDIAVRTWTKTGTDNLSLLAAGVAFYSFLAFVPLLAAVVLIYGIVADPADVPRQMESLVRILPTDAATLVAGQLKGMTETPVTRSAIGLAVAIVLALYGAMRGATSVIGALNVTYGESETRSFIRSSLLSLGFTAGAVLVCVVATLAISAMSLLGGVIHLPRAAAPLVTGGLWLGTALLASGLIAVVYRFGPARKDARWMWLTPGSVFASVGALLATFLFGLYVSRFAGYNATYGALGAVVSFLMWLYVAAFVLLLGAELNAEIEHQTAEDTTTGPARPQGQRGATMADTTARGPHDIGDGEGDHIGPAEPRPDDTPEPPDDKAGTPAWAPVAAGVLAARATRHVGEVPMGVVPMTLLATGLSLIGQRRHAKAGLLCLGAGALMTVRALRRPAPADDA